MRFAMVYLQGCSGEVLEWAIFADQWHLERMEEQAMQCIADRCKDLLALPEFYHLSHSAASHLQGPGPGQVLLMVDSITRDYHDNHLNGGNYMIRYIFCRGLARAKLAASWLHWSEWFDGVRNASM